MIDVVGIDLSLTSTGVAVADATYLVSTKYNGPLRLATVRDSILALLQPLPNPHAVLEGYSFASRNSRAHSIGELGGVVKVALMEAGIPVVLVSPKGRAKFATGNGNAAKIDVMRSVTEITGIPWEGKGANDRCDAWVLQEMGLTQLNRSRYSWPEVNLSALDAVDWTPFERVDSLSATTQERA